ncbi:MobQ family relaxase [Aureimonas altamirensis]|uniref:MobQ family relaxase n=1 Tax=Aureimonas altamirensis TaxID=370622 RepID=UPI0025533A87|nr:MobQ family relaxase [Aureimonas altamirensis]
MAIYHLSAKVISRAGGRSSVGAAAYRSGSVLRNERDGQVHDYSRKRHVEHTEILAPDDAPDWMRNRSKLWNAVEVVEKRKDAQLAREIEVALPRELGADEQRELVRSFAREQFVDRGMIADIAVHNPKASDGQDQPHAHVMLTMRTLTGDGFGPKNRDWNDRDQLGDWRAAWEGHANRALERHGHEARIDHRTLDAQREAATERGDLPQAAALDREPQPKLGMAASGMERRGRESERGGDWRASQARNAERQSLRDQLREIGERIGETMREIGEQVRSATSGVRERLNQAASRLLGRDGSEDRERGDRHEPGSTADRIAQRLRAREAGQERDDRTGRTAEPERGSVPGDEVGRGRDSIRDRLNRAAAQLRERDARHELGERDDGAPPEPEKGLTAERIEERLREQERERDRGRGRGGDRERGAPHDDRNEEHERERDDDRGHGRDVADAGDPDRGPSTIERIEQELMERFQRQFPEERERERGMHEKRRLEQLERQWRRERGMDWER